MHTLRATTSYLLLLAACSGDSTGTTDAASTTTDTTAAADDTGTTAAPDTGDDESTAASPTTTGDDTTGEAPDTTTSGVDEPFLEGAPEPNTAPGDQDVDVFGQIGLRYWFAVDPAQVDKMNEQNNGGGEDIYTPGSAATYANHLFVSSHDDPPTIADYGKVEVRVVGQSTFRPWTPTTLPSLKVDTDEFTDGLEVAGVEHLRFNNSLVGSIFREKIALEVYARLDYPAPRANFAWVGSNVWGPDVHIPYALVEVYKRDFCDRFADAWGGGCRNIWEFVGDFGQGSLLAEQSCQLSSCDSGRAAELEQLVVATPQGPGFKAALADWLDWESFHKFQCLSWVLWTGDDALHNMNNVVLVEREDGKFQYLPYSVDISGGQDWYIDTPLYASNTIATGCQSDADCWADTIAVCEDVIAGFVALDPPGLVDEVHDQLAAEGMLRNGDEGRYKQIRQWYADRAEALLPELDAFRDPPCQAPNVECGDVCVDVQECLLECEEPQMQCQTTCVAPGECFDCQYPFEPCADGACVPPGTCKNPF